MDHKNYDDIIEKIHDKSNKILNTINRCTYNRNIIDSSINDMI